MTHRNNKKEAAIVREEREDPLVFGEPRDDQVDALGEDMSVRSLYRSYFI